MSNIITRGLGSPTMLITRGYGPSLLVRIREVIRLTSRVVREFFLESPWR
jgi:hypothetical protein